MMKSGKSRIAKLLPLVLSALIVAALFAGCSKNDVSLAAPADLSVSKGVLSWTAEENVSYEYGFDGTEYTALEKNEVDLLEVVRSTDITKIYIRAYSGDKKGEAAEFPLTVIQLAAPNKPAVTTDEETNAKRISWNAVENAERYEIKINDGNWTTSAKNYYEPNRTGDYRITVRCKGYAEDGTVYLTSAESETSDNFSFVEAPSLDCPSIHVLRLDTSVEFDSYNLWINKSGSDRKDKFENVNFDGGSLNLVESEIITETGEYDIQVEAIKDGVSWWTATYTEFGTMNINENELFSFDNRANRITPVTQQAAIGISDEQYVGKSDGDVGYSLKIDGRGGNLREIGLLKYADGVNGIDFRDVIEISYWCYVPSGQTFPNGDPVEKLAGGQLPNVRYQELVKAGEENGYATALISPSAESEVPVDTWTQVTLKVENWYDNIIMFAFPQISSNKLVVYMDDITYKKEDRSAIYNAGGVNLTTPSML